MDRKTLLAITLCFLIYLGWQKVYLEPRYHMESSVAPTQKALESKETQPLFPPQSGPAHSETAVSPHEKVQPISQKVTLSTGTGDATLTNSGSFLSGWTLKNYKQGIAASAPAVDLHSVTQQEGEMTLSFDDPNFLYLSEASGQLTPHSQGAVWKLEDNQVKLTREFSASPDKPYIDVRVTAEFKSKAPRYAFISINGRGLEGDPEAQDRQILYWTQQSLERVPLKDSITQKEIATPIKYVGVSNRYFLMTVVSPEGTAPNGLIQSLGPSAGRISLVYPVLGNSVSIPLRVYFGPKELDLLRKVDPTLDHTVDFGWFTLFAYPLLKVLKWLYQFVQNYGLSIIILTLLLKLATYPLTYKSMKSMKKMAKLQPQLQKVREKYKDDREALNREMLVMMKSQGYNPMAGCLPMIIQMPIFFALYRVLYSSIELYHAPFALWIHDLSSRDPYYVTPILLSLTMFVQQKLTPNTATDPAQARMMQLMPLIFGAFMLALPSGLTIYMLVNAIASIIQQLILNKKLDAAPSR